MSVERIARLADRLAQSAEADERWLGAALSQFLAGGDLAAALGVSPRPGNRDPRNIARKAARDTLLRELAAELAPGARISKQASILVSSLSVYASGQWRFDRTRSAPPQQRNARLWKILMLLPVVPGQRSMQEVLKNGTE
jgi:hypothetical protein